MDMGMGMGKRVACVAVVVAAFALLSGCGSPLGGSQASGPGVRYVLQARCPTRNPGCDLSAGVQEAVKVLQGRASRLAGVAAVNVQTDSGGRITVTLTGASDDATARQVLTTEGTFDILDTGSTNLATGTDVTGQTCTTTCQSGQYKVVFTGAQLDPNSISAGLDQQTGQPIVTFAFAGNTKTAFGTYTRNNIGQSLTVTLDNKVIESATIQSEIDSNAEIIGIGSMDQARNLAAYMHYGQLPVALSVVSEAHFTAASS